MEPNTVRRLLANAWHILCAKQRHSLGRMPSSDHQAFPVCKYPFSLLCTEPTPLTILRQASCLGFSSLMHLYKGSLPNEFEHPFYA